MGGDERTMTMMMMMEREGCAARRMREVENVVTVVSVDGDYCFGCWTLFEMRSRMS